MPDLTIYRLVSYLDGAALTDPGQVIDEEGWGDRITQRLDLPETSGLNGRLFVVQGYSAPPRWSSFLDAGFTEDVDVNNVAAPGALLVLRGVWKKKDVFFAFSFGVGRFILKDTAYVRNFGLRVALNAIFEGDTGADTFDPSRLRSVTARRPRANSLRIQGQASRAGAIEDFDVELDRDLLNGLTGSPISETKWGVRISGSNALHVSLPIELKDLAALCKQMCAAHDGADYKARFSWIDDVSRVDDPILRDTLANHLVDLLKSETFDDLHLALPEIVDWPRVQHFTLPHDRKVKHPELRLEDYVSRLKYKGTLAELTPQSLQTQTIVVLDGDEREAYRWSVWRCLSGEFVYGKTTYIIDDADFFAVDVDYMNTLNNYLKAHVPESKLKLPPAVVGVVEGDYNADAATAANLLSLDKRTVTAGRAASAVEVCDLLSTSKQLVHVKRKLGSSTLSHLFSQGLVSAELLLNNAEFRSGASKRIKEAVAERTSEHTPLDADVEFFDTSGLDASEYEVVFAVIADWKKKTLVERLPFFSKVNLRRTAQDLESRRFKVTHVRVETTLSKLGTK